MITLSCVTDDTVYMDDVASREEFVLNDRGRIYRGTQKQISAKPWNFGQVSENVVRRKEE